MRYFQICRNILFLLIFIAAGQIQASSLPEKIFIFPKDGRTPWIHAIEKAEKTIDIAAYRLSDPLIVEALIKGKERGLHIKILYEPYTFSHELSKNEKTPLEHLKEKGILLFPCPKNYKQVHHKMILVDDVWAMIGTGNLDTESFDGDKTIIDVQPCRDFAISTKDKEILKDLKTTFEEDLKGNISQTKNPNLIWGPKDQRARFLSLIENAKEEIIIYQQDIQDKDITNALVKAIKKGIKIRLLMMPFPFNKKEDRNIPHQKLIQVAGGLVGLNTKHYIHAKVMIIDPDTDTSLMVIGSCNFYPSSLDENRELAIITRDPQKIKEVMTIYEKDWQNSDHN